MKNMPDDGGGGNDDAPFDDFKSNDFKNHMNPDNMPATLDELKEITGWLLILIWLYNYLLYFFIQMLSIKKKF